jgi:hypothetical protein
MGKSDVLRSSETIARYKEKRRAMGDKIKEVDLESLPMVKFWEHWTLVENEFPYDLIAERHCLLVPTRKFLEDEEMTLEERQELFEIKKEFAKDKMFDAILENIKHNRTVPLHYHIHCLKLGYRTPASEFNAGLDKK